MIDRDEIIRIWSDDELDVALGALHAETADPTAALAVARAKLLATATGDPDAVHSTPSLGMALPVGATPTNPPARHHRRRWRAALAICVAAAVLGVGLLVPTFAISGNRPVNEAEAIGVLDQAAIAAMGAVDEPVGPGRYRYIETHAWWTTFSGYQVFQDENLIRIWVPADRAQDWMLDRRPTGNRIWITGDEQQARVDGTFMDAVATGVTLRATAPCGNFYAPGPCPRAGSWQDPTPTFLADLPRDPALLYARLQTDAPVSDRGSAELFVYATDALRTGLVQADLRAALYQTLARIEGIELSDRAANLDGRVGMAIGIADGQLRHDIIIDPATGTFIGEREVLTDDLDGAPAGTTMSHTAVRTAVVDAIGAVPSI